VKAFTREQVNLLETARRQAPRYFAVFLTLYQTGVRVGRRSGFSGAIWTWTPSAALFGSTVD